MPRKRAINQREEDEENPLAIRVTKHQDDRDPREPLKTGSTGPEPEQGTVTRINMDVEAKKLVDKYARNLTAHNGDVAIALAYTYEIPIEEAQKRMVELHDHIVGATKTHTDVSGMVERYDLGMNVRLAKLREMMFSPKEAVALKAIEMATEFDATTKAKRIGTTWEQLVTGVRAKAKAELSRGKKAK